MKTISGLIACFIMAMFTCQTAAGDYPAERESFLASGNLTDAPAMMDAEGFVVEGNLRTVLYDALPYRGKC